MNSPVRARRTLSIVIPTYNERESLARLVVAVTTMFAAHGIDGEIVIVDDDSPDGTGQLAETLRERYPVQVVHRPGKLGLGTAVLEGFQVASGRVLGVMDGDLSHPPELVPAMLDLIESSDVDFVVGSRYIPGGGAPDWGVGRLVMSRLACALARGLTPVKDATSGFFLVRPAVVHGVRISAAGFKICLELLIRGRAQSIAEVPYEFTNRTAGASKMNPREALGYLRQLWDLYLWWFTARRASDRRRRYRRVPPVSGQKTLIPAP